MKVIIEIPDGYLDLATTLIPEDEKEKEIVNNAVEKCKGATVEVDFEKVGWNKGDKMKMYMSMAFLAVSATAEKEDSKP